MKSGSAPVRAVPVNFKERPSLQVDPNAVTADGSLVQPIQAVMATDAGGTEETIQRDADGILSTPPWDKNKMAPEYETIVNQDGTGKNDGERNAATRFMTKLRQAPPLKCLVTADRLSSHAPHIETLHAHGLHYLLGVQAGAHASLFAQVQAAEQAGRVPY